MAGNEQTPINPADYLLTAQVTRKVVQYPEASETLLTQVIDALDPPQIVMLASTMIEGIGGRRQDWTPDFTKFSFMALRGIVRKLTPEDAEGPLRPPLQKGEKQKSSYMRDIFGTYIEILQSQDYRDKTRTLEAAEPMLQTAEILAPAFRIEGPRTRKSFCVHITQNWTAIGYEFSRREREIINQRAHKIKDIVRENQPDEA